MTQISVCIPTYNRCSTLRNTISTILDQTYTEFELVVVDNASTDSTEAVIRGFTDPRIRYVRNPFNVGQIENQNRCIEEAAGEIIAIFHDDDIYHPDILRRSLAMLDKYPERRARLFGGAPGSTTPPCAGRGRTYSPGGR